MVPHVSRLPFLPIRVRGIFSYLLAMKWIVSIPMYHQLSNSGQSEMALSYKRRFEKNRDKLFTFLAYDGVPWNNNNAEHAIKQFANYKILSDGKMTVSGLNNPTATLIGKSFNFNEI